MHYSWWDALKDLLGVIGPILIALPWLRDFRLRNLRTKVEGVPAMGRLRRVKETIEGSIRKRIEDPKMADFVWTIVGLLFVFVSFLIAFVRGLGELLSDGS